MVLEMIILFQFICQVRQTKVSRYRYLITKLRFCQTWVETIPYVLVNPIDSICTHYGGVDIWPAWCVLMLEYFKVDKLIIALRFSGTCQFWKWVHVRQKDENETYNITIVLRYEDAQFQLCCTNRACVWKCEMYNMS